MEINFSKNDDKPTRDYLGVLKNTFILGLSSFINLGLGLLRMKAAAIILGPVGIGIIGILQNIMAIGSTISGMGIAQAGTRMISIGIGKNDEGIIESSRKAII